MNIKLKNVVLGKDAVEELSQKEFTAKLSYKISKNIKNLRKEVVDFERKRFETIKKFGVEDPAGSDTYQVKPECIAEYKKEINDLLDVDIEVSIFTININDLEKYEIKPEIIEKLDFMFEDKS